MTRQLFPRSAPIRENVVVVFWFLIAAITLVGAVGGIGALVALGRYAPHD